MNIIFAIICVILFSLTAPFTRLAALEAHAETIILIRILGAGVICIIFGLFDRWIPPRSVWKNIFATALGSVIGFNALMAYGLREVPSGHAAVALAALPMATAVYSILRDKLNPGKKFWFFSILGTLLSFGFFFSLNVKSFALGDIYLLLSVASAALGYVEGGRVSRVYGGRRTMTWAVLFTLPVVIPLSIWYFSKNSNSLTLISQQAWFSMSYLALFSQSMGMFLWFRVLAIGPMEKIALIQLLQPFLTLFAAIFLLHEHVEMITWIVAILVALCVFGTSREKNKIEQIR